MISDQRLETGAYLSKSRRGPATRATMLDVARYAGVSIMTVSRVINGEGAIRKRTRDAVDAAILALKYVPNSAARSLAGKGRIRIGLLHDNRCSGLMSELMLGCLDQARRSNVELSVRACRSSQTAYNAADGLIRSGVDGLILPPPLCEDSVLLDILSTSSVPAVAIASSLPREEQLVVRIDDCEAATVMTRHILGLGHRRIGFIGGHPGLSASAERLRGYQVALGEVGIGVDTSLIVPGDFTYRSGLQAAERLLNMALPPTAIFSSNDDMAAAAIAVAQRRGMDVPADLTICGFDNTVLSIAMWPSITTISQPIAKMATVAIKMLVDIHKRRNISLQRAKQQVLGYQLIRRGSDAPLWPF